MPLLNMQVGEGSTLGVTDVKTQKMTPQIPPLSQNPIPFAYVKTVLSSSANLSMIILLPTPAYKPCSEDCMIQVAIY